MPDLKDASSPKLIKQLGGYHPINQIKDSIMNLISSFGFEIINGPEIETEEFNFDMLNIKKSLSLIHISEPTRQAEIS